MANSTEHFFCGDEFSKNVTDNVTVTNNVTKNVDPPMSDEYVAPMGPSTGSSLGHEFCYIYACLRKGIFGDNPHVKNVVLETNWVRIQFQKKSESMPIGANLLSSISVKGQAAFGTSYASAKTLKQKSRCIDVLLVVRAVRRAQERAV